MILLINKSNGIALANAFVTFITLFNKSQKNNNHEKINYFIYLIDNRCQL